MVFLTALTQESDEAKGLNLGAVDYITKPFRSELVKARVHNHLELKRHKDQLQTITDAFEALSENFRQIALEFADHDEALKKRSK